MKRALAHLLAKGYLPRVVLDIGASKGWWSLMCSNFFPEAEYFLIEPLAENEENLREACARNPRFHYIHTALGAKPGRHLMNVASDCDGSSLLSWPGVDPSRQRMVPVTTGDQLLRDKAIQPPDLIKIDVQGYEREVFRGAEQAVGHASVILTEVSLYEFLHGCPLVHEIVAYLAERDFHLFDVASIARRPYENDLGQMDLVFASAKSNLMSSNRWC